MGVVIKRVYIRLSVPFSDCVPFAWYRYVHIATWNAFSRGQFGRLCLHPNAVSSRTHTALSFNAMPFNACFRVYVDLQIIITYLPTPVLGQRLWESVEDGFCCHLTKSIRTLKQWKLATCLVFIYYRTLLVWGMLLSVLSKYAIIRKSQNWFYSAQGGNPSPVRPWCPLDID